MKRTIPWGRAIATVLAVATFAVAVQSAGHWWQMRTKCADAEATVLAVLPDAFGTKGTTEVDFRPDYDFTCGREMLVVEHDLPNRSRDQVTATVKGLHAELTIVDGTGEAVLKEDLTDEWFCPFLLEQGTDSFLPAFPFHSVRSGHYRLRLTVTEPAVPLVGIPHRVVARYQLCGVDRIAATFMGGIALVSALVCLVLTTGVIVVTRRKRRHANKPDARGDI